MISRIGYPVTERRLRPIYDALDNGNNKKALQEAEKVLKKQPNLQCAKVLKCLAMLRMGKETECIDQLEIIKNECPVDEPTLQLMTVCYRDLNKPNLICQVYENAIQKDRGSEDILNNLFTSYVRIANYKKQQQTALNLYKLNPKNQYYFWAVISILLQSVNDVSDLSDVFSEPIYSPHICPRDRPYSYNYLCEKDVIKDKNKKLLVKLVEKMLEKFLSENKIEGEQEFLVYLIFLDLEAKYEEALDILDSPLASLLEQSTLLNFRLSFFTKLRRWSTINIIVKEELENGVEGWNYLLYYIDSAYELDKGNGEEKEFLKAQEFIENLAKESTGLKKRGPYLARLELCSRFSKVTNVLNCFVEYFNEFGAKESCVHDLKPYLHLLHPDSCNEFLQLILEPMKSNKTSRSLMDFHICNEELARVVACKTVDKRVYVGQLMQCFIDALEFNVDLPPTETRSSDRYALLALYTLYDSWIENQTSNFLFEAIVICHYALSYSPSNSQFKTLLLKFYHLLGCSEGAHNAYLSLDIKHMQLDTLGYLHVFPLIANGSYVNAATVMISTLKFFTNNRKESADHISLAYKYDAYTKIPEMIAIKEKLNNSIHYHQVYIERMLLGIFLSESYNNAVQNAKDFDIIPQNDHIPWANLQDNRDLKVLWDLEPRSQSLTNKEILITKNIDIVYLKLRSLLLRIIVAGIQVGSSNLENMNEPDAGYDSGGSNVSPAVTTSKSILVNLTNELDEDVRKMKNTPPKPFSKKPSIASPPKSRLLLVFNQNYFDIILNELWFLLGLMPGSVPGKESGESECKCRLGAIMVLWEQFATSFPIRSLYIEKRDELLQLCSLYVELVSFSCIVIGICESILYKIKLNLAKKNKKKKDSSQRIADMPVEYEWRAKILNQFVIFLTDTLKNVESLLKSEEKMLNGEIERYGEFEIYNVIKQEINEKKFDKHTNSVKHQEWVKLESMSKMVNENLINSHISSVNKMLNVLKLRLKYLGSLKI